MTIAQLITRVRTLANDVQDQKAIFSETLGGSDQLAYPVDGSNTVFRLKNVPLADAPGAPTFTFVTIIGTGAVTRSQSGFVITDQVNGIITFTAAPNPGTSPANAGVYVDYNYIFFTDAKWTEFISQAAQTTLAGITDATALVEGLIEPALYYAAALAYRALAGLYAARYESSGGDASEHVQTVTQAYLALAKSMEARGDFLKVDYYKRQGQRELPSSQDGNVNFDSISPKR